MGNGEIRDLPGSSARVAVKSRKRSMEWMTPRGTIGLDSVPVIAFAKAAIRHGIYLIPEDRRQSGILMTDCIRDNISLPALNATRIGYRLR